MAKQSVESGRQVYEVRTLVSGIVVHVRSDCHQSRANHIDLTIEKRKREEFADVVATIPLFPVSPLYPWVLLVPPPNTDQHGNVAK